MPSQFSNASAKRQLKTSSGNLSYYQISKLTKLGFKDPAHLPFSIKVLLESALRNCDNYQVTTRDLETLTNWSPTNKALQEIAFKPGRVILQDFTGVPCVVDLAAMRDAIKKMGGDIKKINPLVPCDLVIDHSVQVDDFGTKKALSTNVTFEFKRNKERYEFLNGRTRLKISELFLAATGIVHQVKSGRSRHRFIAQKSRQRYCYLSGQRRRD